MNKIKLFLATLLVMAGLFVNGQIWQRNTTVKQVAFGDTLTHKITTTKDVINSTNDTLEIGHNVIIMLTDTISEMSTLADASGDLGKASTLMTNVYTESISDGNFKRKYLTVTLADDATYNLPSAKVYGISYRTSDGSERSQSINVLADGSVSVDMYYGILGTVNTDSDNKVCIYDGGTYAVLRNRTGNTKTFYLILWGDL